jgi:hypothetical protein
MEPIRERAIRTSALLTFLALGVSCASDAGRIRLRFTDTDRNSTVIGTDGKSYIAILSRRSWLDSMAQLCANYHSLTSRIAAANHVDSAFMFVNRAVHYIQVQQRRVTRQLRVDSIPISPAGYAGPFTLSGDRIGILVSPPFVLGYLPIDTTIHGEQRMSSAQPSTAPCNPPP